MVADLLRALAHVRHVAVAAGHPGARVNALVPHFELGMLGLECRRSGLGVRPVGEARLAVVLVDLLRLQALGPRIRQPLLRALEVVLDVTLPADEAAHLLPGRHRVHVVVLHALAGLQGPDTFDETRPGHAQRHRIGCMTIDARDRMREGLARLGIRHLVVVLEALDQVAVPGLLVGHVDRRVTVDAGARLLELLHALGEGLVLEHVRVTALLAEIRGKRVARPHRLQPGIFLQARLRHDRARVGFGG